MKRKINWIIAICLIAISCQKPVDKMFSADENLTSAKLANISVTCPPTVLSGTISSNMTLTTGTAYLLRGNVDVDNATLTIQPGVLIMGEKATNGALIIKKNAQISAVGTVTNPIIFTSDQAPGSRAAGDWFGVAILGNAPNNRSNNLSLAINGTTFNAGGTSVTSSAGSLQYVQIHYAGAGGGAGSDVLTESALILGSIGSGMTIRNVQISKSKLDGLGVWGGEVGVKEVFAQEIKRTDFRLSQGFKGNMQNLLGFKDKVIASAANTQSFDISNELLGTTSTRFTYPIISNVTLLGGKFCSGGDLNYNDAFVFRNEGNGQIYNSVIEGFNRYGLLLSTANIVGKTAAGTDPLQFSNNSIHNVSTSYFAQIPSTWAVANGCRLNSLGTMQDWIEGLAGVSCQESGNQFTLTATGYYNSSLCGTDKCSNFPNLYINPATADLDAPDYSMLSGFFDQPDYRGALQTSANTWLKNTWIDFCTQRDYCH